MARQASTELKVQKRTPMTVSQRHPNAFFPSTYLLATPAMYNRLEKIGLRKKFGKKNSGIRRYFYPFFLHFVNAGQSDIFSVWKKTYNQSNHCFQLPCSFSLTCSDTVS